MFCGNIFTSTDLQNHKKNHMKKSQKRFHRVNRALFLSLSNVFEEQRFRPKIFPKNFLECTLFSQNCLRGTVCYISVQNTSIERIQFIVILNIKHCVSVLVWIGCTLADVGVERCKKLIKIDISKSFSKNLDHYQQQFSSFSIP